MTTWDMKHGGPSYEKVGGWLAGGVGIHNKNGAYCSSVCGPKEDADGGHGQESKQVQPHRERQNPDEDKLCPHTAGLLIDCQLSI